MSLIALPFQRGYIIDARHDALWFLSLPFISVALALLAHRYLPGGALVAVTLWITVPHFLITGLRVYGSPAEFTRWRERFILSPILLILFAFALAVYAPLTLVLLVTLWDHQHSLMQQYGFARIYDFKAKTGGPRGGKFDLYFNWVFFFNMLLVSPLFSTVWVRMLHEWRLPISAAGVELVHQVSWTLTIAYGLAYVGYMAWCLRRGHPLNPLKYLFLLSSYFLWYFTSFTSEYLMVYAVAHRLMHGIQYIAMIYYFNRNRVERIGGDSSLLTYLAKPGHFKVFLLLCAASMLIWLALTEGSIRDLGFGLVGYSESFDLFSYSLVSSVALIHYWFDAFIWKVRRPEVQQGL